MTLPVVLQKQNNIAAGDKYSFFRKLCQFPAGGSVTLPYNT